MSNIRVSTLQDYVPTESTPTGLRKGAKLFLPVSPFHPRYPGFHVRIVRCSDYFRLLNLETNNILHINYAARRQRSRHADEANLSLTEAKQLLERHFDTA